MGVTGVGPLQQRDDKRSGGWLRISTMLFSAHTSNLRLGRQILWAVVLVNAWLQYQVRIQLPVVSIIR